MMATAMPAIGGRGGLEQGGVELNLVQHCQCIASMSFSFLLSGSYIISNHGPGVSLYLLYEDTGHPKLPRVKLAQ